MRGEADSWSLLLLDPHTGKVPDSQYIPLYCARRISAVRGEADGWSLLLLDELGTGTDPTEGAALGQALLKTLVRGMSAHRLCMPCSGL